MEFFNLNTERFINLINSSEIKLVLFGCGRSLENIALRWKELSIQNNKIAYFIDNDENKRGKNVTFLGNHYTIQHINDVVPVLDKTDIIVITSYEYSYAMLTQLDSLNVANKCVVYQLMEELSEYEYGLKNVYPLRRSKDIQIPKIIHYCWFGGKEIPKDQQKYMETWQEYCPDYEFVCWNEKTYDVNKIPYMSEAYQSGRMGFVADYARLDILYQYGGIYLDTDVELLRSLDDLLYQKAYCGFQMGKVVNLGSGVGSISKLDIIKEMRDEYIGIHFRKDEGIYNLKSCPYYQTRTLEKFGLARNNQYQIVEEMAIYPTDTLCGVGGLSGKYLKTPNTFSFHRPSLSWADRERIDRLNKTMDYFGELT